MQQLCTADIERWINCSAAMRAGATNDSRLFKVTAN
jgi:hypothetical protein